MLAYLVSLLLGEDPIEGEADLYAQDGGGFVITSDLDPHTEPQVGKTDGSTAAPSSERRVGAVYAFGALGLLLTIVVALVLPTFIASPCPSGLDCSRHLNIGKVVLILPGLIVAFTGLLVGACWAQSE